MDNDLTVHAPRDVTRSHITEHLAYLGQDRMRSGVTRARKLAAIREYFRLFVEQELLAKSPAETVERPKQAQNERD